MQGTSQARVSEGETEAPRAIWLTQGCIHSADERGLGPKAPPPTTACGNRGKGAPGPGWKQPCPRACRMAGQLQEEPLCRAQPAWLCWADLPGLVRGLFTPVCVHTACFPAGRPVTFSRSSKGSATSQQGIESHGGRQLPEPTRPLQPLSGRPPGAGTPPSAERNLHVCVM